VYVVTSGEYSDYHIDAVFDSREAAEVYCALGHGEYVEDYDVNAEATAKPTQSIVYRYWVCYPTRDTEWILEPAYLLESDIEADRQMIEVNKRYHLKWNVIDCDYHTDRYVYLKERNKSKALKIVRDRIAKAKAEREGL
jgi:hypothetical protein